MDKNLNFKISKKLINNAISIFLFHGVIKKNNFLVRNYTNKHIQESFFEKLIIKLKKTGTAISMDDVLNIYENKEKIRGKLFAITFDDGFENNLSIAYPILRDNKIPMMSYLTTNFINLNEMSWIDKIEHAIEKTKKKEILIDQKVFKINTLQDKILFLNSIRSNYKRKKNIDLYKFANQIIFKAGFDKISNLRNQLDLKMSWDQILKYKDDKYISFGGHGHSHRILSFLTKKKLKNELEQCKKFLLKKGKIETSHFSYPEGLKYCYSFNVINNLKKLNFRCSPTAIEGANKENQNLFNLKRIMVS